MSKLTKQENLDLKKLLRESDATDNTEYIRRVKHSLKIRDDVLRLTKLKETYSGEQLKSKALEFAPFLYENYQDIFKKVIEDELDLEIMSRLLLILKLIEDAMVDQHEASVMVGKILKELYVDSALKRCKKLDEAQQGVQGEGQQEEPTYVEEKPISWAQWRTKRAEIIENLGEHFTK
jgi:hypothetical protein